MSAILGIACLLLPGLSVQKPEVDYHLELSKAGDKRVSITIETEPLPFPQTLVMPRAIPMGYGEQPYDRFVSALYAEDDRGNPVLVSREEGPRWRITGKTRLKRIRYTVDLGRMEREILSAADSSKSRARYLGVLGYSVFAYIDGLENKNIKLHLRGPDGWQMFSTLAPRLPAPQGFTQVYAHDFYALADSQIAMGPVDRGLVLHRVEGRPSLYLALYAEGPVEVRSLGRIGRSALDAMCEYFGNRPFGKYSMHLEYLRPISDEHEYGFSMEHMQSSTYFLRHDQGLTKDAGPAEIRRIEYNFAHHIAHSWIPKRSYGEGYFPFSWEVAPVLDSIWFSEGFAQYAAMDALSARREGGEAMLERMVENRFQSNLDKQPDVFAKMTTVELSRLASTRYSQDFRTGRGIFSRGGMMAAEMDERIRRRTDDEKGLRDALRYLFKWSETKGRAFTLEELPFILEAGCDVDLRSIYDRWMGPQPR
ncbi:MAG: M61 family metallopeptidase [Planctomycetota bacterium]|jgi:predicted metalloprotease with PDZ domain